MIYRIATISSKFSCARGERLILADPAWSSRGERTRGLAGLRARSCVRARPVPASAAVVEPTKKKILVAPTGTARSHREKASEKKDETAARGGTRPRENGRK